jgi:hypothetical protein
MQTLLLVYDAAAAVAVVVAVVVVAVFMYSKDKKKKIIFNDYVFKKDLKVKRQFHACNLANTKRSKTTY